MKEKGSLGGSSQRGFLHFCVAPDRASQLYRDVRRACKSMNRKWYRSETNELILWPLNGRDISQGYLGGTLDRALVVCSKSESEFLTMPLSISREASCDRLHSHPGWPQPIREENEVDNSRNFCEYFLFWNLDQICDAALLRQENVQLLPQRRDN